MAWQYDWQHFLRNLGGVGLGTAIGLLLGAGGTYYWHMNQNRLRSQQDYANISFFRYKAESLEHDKYIGRSIPGNLSLREGCNQAITALQKNIDSLRAENSAAEQQYLNEKTALETEQKSCLDAKAAAEKDRGLYNQQLGECRGEIKTVTHTLATTRTAQKQYDYCDPLERAVKNMDRSQFIDALHRYLPRVGKRDVFYYPNIAEQLYSKLCRSKPSTPKFLRRFDDLLTSMYGANKIHPSPREGYTALEFHMLSGGQVRSAPRRGKIPPTRK